MLHLGVRLDATCFATRPLVWREIGLADLDLFHCGLTALDERSRDFAVSRGTLRGSL